MIITPELTGPCPRCSGLNFWRDRKERIRCAHSSRHERRQQVSALNRRLNHPI